MLKVFEFRMVIEPEAASLAALRITKEQLEELEEYLRLGMAEDCSREVFRSLDVKFHLTIAKASNNLYYEKAVRQIRTLINPVLDLMPYDHDIRAINNEKHARLLEAIKSRDHERSKEMMRQHISKSADAIKARVFDNI
ncbi:transcriptional regulator NanR [compost metagenome]